jgi:hypothetical protein
MSETAYMDYLLLTAYLSGFDVGKLGCSAVLSLCVYIQYNDGGLTIHFLELI